VGQPNPCRDPRSGASILEEVPVSYDLAVWYEPTPITPEAADAKLKTFVENEDDSSFEPSDKVQQCYDELLRKFPFDGYAAVWIGTPPRSDDRVVDVYIPWSQADRVAETVRELARQHGLICYDPQAGVVNPNVPGYAPAFELITETHPRVPDPNAERVERAVSKLSNDNYFAIVERADGWYAQVGYGVSVGVKPGTYATDEHYRTETTDRVAATRFLQEFLAGEEAWKRRHA
jgi:hypothetical protein